LAILLYDATGRLVGVNKACRKMVGLVDDTTLPPWPNIFADATVPDSAKEALRRAEIARYQTRVDYDRLSKAVKYGLKRSGTGFVDVLVTPLGVEPDGRVSGYMSQVQDVTELEERGQRLRSYQRQLQSLASQLSLAEEKERRRLAILLHDQVGQLLAIVKFKLARLREMQPSSGAQRSLDEIEGLLGDAIRETRSLTFDLSPPVLYELGLESALEWVAKRFEAQYGIKCTVRYDETLKPLSDDLRGLLFNAVRELLVNVVKHARAHAVAISVMGESAHILVRVEDDGVGFNTSDPRWRSQGFGLFNARERLSAIGGHMQIRSQPGCGTSVVLAAPLSAGDVPTEGMRWLSE
ncbi:MAG: sensor histidine kinase, partial [Chloroflexi bacterium]|nr:sensor histidine kinase [Chloroflexota bacterium]